MASEDTSIIKYAYAEDELTIMRSYLKDFKSMKSSQRKTLLSEKVVPLLNRIPRVAEIKEQGKVHWNDYKRKLKVWFSNRSQRPSFCDNVAKRRPTIAVMVNRLFPDLVAEAAVNLANVGSGGTTKSKRIAFFQPACKQVYEALSPDGKGRVQTGIEEWTTKSYPLDIQIKRVQTRSLRDLRSTTDNWRHIYGMTTLILELHPSEIGGNRYAVHDFTGDPHARILKLSDKDPEGAKAIKDVIERYTKYVTARQKCGEEPDVTPVDNRSVDKESLQYITEDADGYPIIADIAERLPKLPECKAIIRNFFRMHYFKASGSVRVPWAMMVDDPFAYIEPGSIPEDLRLCDPSGMRDVAVKKLVHHLILRQSTKSPSQVLRFHHVSDGVDKNGVDKRVPASYGNHLKRRRQGRSASVMTVTPLTTPPASVRSVRSVSTHSIATVAPSSSSPAPSINHNLSDARTSLNEPSPAFSEIHLLMQESADQQREAPFTFGSTSEHDFEFQYGSDSLRMWQNSEDLPGSLPPVLTTTKVAKQGKRKAGASQSRRRKGNVLGAQDKPRKGKSMANAPSKPASGTNVAEPSSNNQEPNLPQEPVRRSGRSTSKVDRTIRPLVSLKPPSNKPKTPKQFVSI